MSAKETTEREIEMLVRRFYFNKNLFGTLRNIIKEYSYTVFPKSSKCRMRFVRKMVANLRVINVLHYLMHEHNRGDGVMLSKNAQCAVFIDAYGKSGIREVFLYINEKLKGTDLEGAVRYRQGFSINGKEGVIHPCFYISSADKLGKKYQTMQQITTEEEVMEVTRKVCAFFDYLRETNADAIPEEYKEFAENYYKYTIDMEEASAICKKRNGCTFDEIEEYFKGCSQHTGAKYYTMCNALREYSMCKSFSSGKFCVKMSYGRLYAPFHNLCKEYRSAFRYKASGEKVVEVTDMKGAFVKGSICAAMCVNTAIGNKEVSEKLSGILCNMTDPYKFMMDCGFDRGYAKENTLRTLFSSEGNLKNRERILKNMEVLGNEKEVSEYCKMFLNMVESNPFCKYMKDSELNKYFKCISEDRIVFYTLTGKKYKNGKKVTFTNSNKGSAYSLSSYIRLCELCLAAVGQKAVFNSMEKVYGSDVVSAILTTIRIFDAYNKKVMDAFQEHVNNKCSRKNGLLPLRKQYTCDTMHTSILCQSCEGEMMFGSVLPELFNKTGCKSIVTLHDAIYMPESFSKMVNCKELAKNLDIKFYETIVKFFMSNNACKEAVKLYKEKGCKNAA